MNGQTDFTVKAEPEDFKNTLFLAMELSRATWLVATFSKSVRALVRSKESLAALTVKHTGASQEAPLRTDAKVWQGH